MTNSIFDLITTETENINLSDNQKKNISKLLHLSNKFSKDAEIMNKGSNLKQSEISSNQTIVLESGHQPNYFPYSGTFKKVFLTNNIYASLKEEDKSTIAFFGFADQNLGTSQNIYKNVIPAYNKYGVEKIGFNIKGKDKWKCFETIEKPSLSEWENEIEKINNIYYQINPTNFQNLSEIMWKSYDKAKNFSDLNAFIFSKICTETFSLNIHFFRYSDIHKNGIFLDETKNLLKFLKVYNSKFNSEIETHKLNIRLTKAKEIPLWFHCKCGGKILTEQINEEYCSGTCPICKKIHNLKISSNFEGLDKYYKNMSFSAVARNLIFAEGLGTAIFIAGSGGGLTYGQISDSIAPLIGFNLPTTLVWVSRDYYLGYIQKLAIKNFKKIYELDEESLISTNLNSLIIEKQKKILSDIINSEHYIDCNQGNNKSFKSKKGTLLNLRMAGTITSKIFSLTPSFLDLFMNIDSSEIANKWKVNLKYCNVEQLSKAYLLKQNITYEDNRVQDIDSEKIPILFHNLTNIPVIKIDEKHSCSKSTHR